MKNRREEEQNAVPEPPAAVGDGIRGDEDPVVEKEVARSRGDGEGEQATK